jgi:tungstate transport system substrate-binding protein
MYNDFVIVGPAGDPAGVARAKDATGALKAIAGAKAPFVSRGDDSGTHQRELALWTAAGANPEGFDPQWYREAGAGMGATSTLRPAWTPMRSPTAAPGSLSRKGGLTILFQGDETLHNQYAFIPVNPKRHPHVNFDAATAVRDWLTGDRGQGMIADFKIGGEPAFVPNAKRSGA